MSGDPNKVQVKKEPAAAAAAASSSSSPSSSPPVAQGTTIGGVQKVQFAPRIPVRRKTAEGSVASASSDLRDLITTKPEKKSFRPNLSAARTFAAPAAKVAFQPSSGGSGGGKAENTRIAAGDEQRDVALVVTHQAGVKIPGQHVEEDKPTKTKAQIKREEAAAAAAAAGITGADGVSIADSSMSAEELAEAEEEEELNDMLARETSYDNFLDNGDPKQYRPILLPFPKVRKHTAGARSAAPSPIDSSRPSSAFGVNMFDIDDDAAAAAAAAVGTRSLNSSRASSPTTAPYKALPLHSPARLLGKIDHEEKSSGVPSKNILFFQFPSHLPFKQAPTWSPPVNPLLSLNGFRQSSLGTSTSAISFGANTNDATHQGLANASRNLPTTNSAASSSAANAQAPSPSLQALQALSSPMLPPIAGLSVPSLSLGHTANTLPPSLSGNIAAAGLKQKGGKPGMPSTLAAAAAAAAGPTSGLMDDVGTSSALATEEEQDLGEVSKNDPNKLSESERLAREHKARQQRKLLLFSSNFEHAMRHLPSGQLGSLVIYKSGKIKMRIGDVLLDVNEGVQCLFHQELMSVNAGSSEAFRLGAVNHRLVCTNDVEDLVRKTRERAIPSSQRT